MKWSFFFIALTFSSALQVGRRASWTLSLMPLCQCWLSASLAWTQGKTGPSHSSSHRSRSRRRKRLNIIEQGEKSETETRQHGGHKGCKHNPNTSTTLHSYVQRATCVPLVTVQHPTLRGVVNSQISKLRKWTHIFFFTLFFFFFELFT